MRKAPREGLRQCRHRQPGRRGCRPPSLAILGVLVVLTGVVVALPAGGVTAQDQSARVEIEFEGNGRCTVSSAGDGFRSHATYMPKPGARQTELRCAMPPVSSGRTVALVVSLPVGAPRPGASVPPLEWVPVQGRWIGTAQLTKWPDAVVVVPGGRWLAARNIITAAVAVVAIMIGAAIATYIRRSRLVKPAG
jgi:hypothetical protein